jgi:hypothetical protein
MPVGSPDRRIADMSTRIYGQQADPAPLPCSNSPTSHLPLPRFGSPRGIRRPRTSSSCCCFETGWGCFSQVSSLFSITPSNFEVAKTGASARFSQASPGEFDLRACVCFVTWNGRGMVGASHCDKVGAAGLVLVVTAYVGGAQFVGGGVIGAAGAAEVH